MDTHSNITAQKKIVSIDFVGWKAKGYGPKGEHTREDWRAECLTNLLAGVYAFDAWQNSWKSQIVDDLPRVNFGVVTCFGDGSKLEDLTQSYDGMSPYTLDFSGHSFDNLLDCGGYTFQQTVLFNCSIFSGSVFFNLATFSGSAVFRFATFYGLTHFSAIFSGSADFYSATFKGLALFCSATFNEGGAYFNETNFNGGADFGSATFSGNAYFFLTTFGEYAGFGGVTFIRDANFSQATFCRQCRFHNSFDKKNRIWSQETVFCGVADFDSAVFKNVGHFERVKFIETVPSFLGVDTAATRLEFSSDEYFPKHDFSERAVRRFGHLKRLSDEHGQIDQSLMFNAFELNAKAKQPDASCIFIVFTWLYSKVSNYGRSFGRPLLTYLGLVSITYTLAIFAAAHNSPQDCKGEFWRVFSDMRDNGWPSCLSAELPDDKLRLNGYRAAFEYTTYRAAGILDFSDNDKQTVAVSKRLFNADVEPTWMRFWGIFKAIASAALLFLAALGLRNKYRIK